MSDKRILCPACKSGIHTTPPKGSIVCQCETRTCACYGRNGFPAGIRSDLGYVVFPELKQ